jgi:FMN phosphatase YigB (HAD superfamily)
MPVRAVFFDVGETIVDETVLWQYWADHFGIPRFTFFAVFGALIERGEDHQRIFEVFGVTRDGSWPGFGAEHLYPDALPCLRTLRERGLRIGLVGNTSPQIEDILRTLDLPVDVIGSSGRWGVEKPTLRSSSASSPKAAPLRTKRPTSVTVSTTMCCPPSTPA